MSKKALITGISGQDGVFLSKFLFENGYDVHGIIRRSSQDALNMSQNNRPFLTLHYGDLQDFSSLMDIVLNIKPDEVYNLAAQSHVGISFKNPEYTCDVTGMGAVRMLNACHLGQNILKKQIRYYQASSSEQFGKVKATPQNEETPFHPRSPYACAKVFAHHSVVNYREAYGMHASCGILFNHESELRGDDFVTRKITKGVASIITRKIDSIWLGNLDARRDWGYAGDYVEAMWLMLQQDQPDDYVIATGINNSVREFVQMSFAEVGVIIQWHGEGIDEVAVVESVNNTSVEWLIGKTVVKISPEFYRPSEVDKLIGDASKARRVLKWCPKTSLKSMITKMIKTDLELLGYNGTLNIDHSWQ